MCNYVQDFKLILGIHMKAVKKIWYPRGSLLMTIGFGISEELTLTYVHTLIRRDQRTHFHGFIIHSWYIGNPRIHGHTNLFKCCFPLADSPTHPRLKKKRKKINICIYRWVGDFGWVNGRDPGTWRKEWRIINLPHPTQPSSSTFEEVY